MGCSDSSYLPIWLWCPKRIYSVCKDAKLILEKCTWRKQALGKRTSTSSFLWIRSFNCKMVWIKIVTAPQFKWNEIWSFHISWSTMSKDRTTSKISREPMTNLFVCSPSPQSHSYVTWVGWSVHSITQIVFCSHAQCNIAEADQLSIARFVVGSEHSLLMKAELWSSIKLFTRRHTAHENSLKVHIIWLS